MTKTFTLPTYLAPPLINGDYSGLGDDDVPAVEAALLLAAGGHFVAVADDGHYSRINDLPGSLGYMHGDVATFTVLFTEEA